MSIIFGILDYSDQPVRIETLAVLGERTSRYAPDGTYTQAIGPLAVGFQPYHTTDRSMLESWPLPDVHGNLVVFDGRLDNYQELQRDLDIDSANATDSSLVLAAFSRWHEACFLHFIGDWALALWSEQEHKLYLARDHAGSRTLYYREFNGQLQWSTYLETLLEEGTDKRLDDEFAARYLGGLPNQVSTPYAGILGVPPAHFMVFAKRQMSVKAHWSPIAKGKIICKSDAEYDELFVAHFQQSIRRRTGPGGLICAELSGGMDSTAIVCMSDYLRRLDNPVTDLIETISYYDDSEPDWNEKPFFSMTEAYRGKVGIHIASSFLDRSFHGGSANHRPFPFPGPDANAHKFEDQFEESIAGKRYRVILSGIGGDELLGGVPTPYPELADHLYAFELGKLFRRTTAWCLSSRAPFPHTFLNTVKFAVNIYGYPGIWSKELIPWLTPRLQEACIQAAEEDPLQGSRSKLCPSSVAHARNWFSILETLPHLRPKNAARREYRYPYLDRDLVSFLLRLPREQLVQPGRRRAMMRRALKELMPIEVVERRRKAFVGRGPLALIQRERANLENLFASPHMEGYGWIDGKALRSALQSVVGGGHELWTMPLLRTAAFELWLRSQHGRFAFGDSLSDIAQPSLLQALGANEIPARQTVA